MGFLEKTDEDKKLFAYTLGVDLGQSQDYTAIALIEQEIGRVSIDWEQSGSGLGGDYVEVEYPLEEIVYNVVGLTRLPLQTPYPDQVRQVTRILKSIPVAGRGLARNEQNARKNLAVDRTGCGRPVVDLFVQAGLAPIGISITGGDTVTKDGDHYRVPKRELVNLVKVLLQQGRLKISRQLPEHRILMGEMNNFTYKITDSANDVYGREGQHDDMLLALAVGLWVARQQTDNLLQVYGPGDEAFDLLSNFTGT